MHTVFTYPLLNQPCDRIGAVILTSHRSCINLDTEETAYSRALHLRTHLHAGMHLVSARAFRQAGDTSSIDPPISTLKKPKKPNARVATVHVEASTEYWPRDIIGDSRIEIQCFQDPQPAKRRGFKL